MWIPVPTITRRKKECPPPTDYIDYKRLEDGLAPRSRLEEGAGRSTLTLRKVRAVFELRHEDAVDHSTLALNKSVDVHTLDDHPRGSAPRPHSRRSPEGFGTTSTLSTITRGVGTPIEGAGAPFW